MKLQLGSELTKGIVTKGDLRKSIVGSLDRIDNPLLSGPYSKPVSLLLICRSRVQAEYGVTLPQSVRRNQASDDLVLLIRCDY